MNGYPGADWVSNVRAADHVTLTQGRRSERVRMVELRRRKPARSCASSPRRCRPASNLMKRAGVLTDGTPDELEALAGRLRGVSHRPGHVAFPPYVQQRAIRLPWWLKYVNKVMIGLQKLGVGFGGKGPVVLTVPGRKSR